VSIRFSTFKPTTGLFENVSCEENQQLSFTFPVATETPRGYYLATRVPGIGYFLPKDKWTETKKEWRTG